MARNVIERCFGLLKGRWVVLRETSFFRCTHGHIIMACCLLRNLIKRYMPPRSIDEEIYEEEGDDASGGGGGDDDEDEGNEAEYISFVEPSDPWTNFRSTMAQTMFNNWRARSNRN